MSDGIFFSSHLFPAAAISFITTQQNSKLVDITVNRYSDVIPNTRRVKFKVALKNCNKSIFKRSISIKVNLSIKIQPNTLTTTTLFY